MEKRKLYRKRPKYHVTAVQLDLDFDGFSYQKWGGTQNCKKGDWIVNNNDDIYTVDKEYFRDFYQRISPGVFEKVGEIWAEVAENNGSIETKEGSTDYKAGDYLVFDRQEGGEGYAIKRHKFKTMYEQIDETFELTHEQQAYLNDRIIPKKDDFDVKAKRNQSFYHFCQITVIVAAALVPVFSGFVNDETIFFKWLVAFLGGTSAIFAGLLSLFKFQENWIRYRSTNQDLESHISLFNIGASVYRDKKNAFNLLVDNCERILNAERGRWAEKFSKEKKKDVGS